MIKPKDITVRIGGTVIAGEPGIYISMRLDGISLRSMDVAKRLAFEETLRLALVQWNITYDNV